MRCNRLDFPDMSKVNRWALALPALVFATSLSYPAAGQHAVFLGAATASRAESFNWLLSHGARISGRTPDGNVVFHLPSDRLAVEALGKGILLVSAPSAACSGAEVRQ